MFFVKHNKIFNYSTQLYIAFVLYTSCGLRFWSDHARRPTGRYLCV